MGLRENAIPRLDRIENRLLHVTSEARMRSADYWINIEPGGMFATALEGLINRPTSCPSSLLMSSVDPSRMSTVAVMNQQAITRTNEGGGEEMYSYVRFKLSRLIMNRK